MLQFWLFWTQSDTLLIQETKNTVCTLRVAATGSPFRLIITYRQKMAADSRAVESGEFWRSDQEIKNKEAQLSRINALRSTWRPLD